MRPEVIKADTIDAAVDGILDQLKGTRGNVIYFDGWDGLGASAVLRAVAERLKLRPPGLQFEQIIDIDCSKWESRRAMQRAIAEQLKLPSRVMDEQDEEDDFNGVAQGSRGGVAQVVGEIYQTIQNLRFLVILHNGSNEEIDISNIGLPVYGYLSNKILWTFQGRFRLDAKSRDRMKKNTTDVFLSASRFERDPQELWSYLLREEAAQVSCKCGIDPAVVVQCFLYMLKLYCIGGHHIVEYDFATHSCNYWTCDGIIQQQATDIGKAWQVGDALQHEMRLDMIMDYYHNAAGLPSHLIRYAERVPYWISTATCGFVMSPTGGVIPSNNMFQHSDRLGVLKLSRCTFNFSSPPFLCCRSLRFLWLDRCQDLLTTGPSTTTDQHADAAKQEEEEELLDKSSTATSASWACFHSLWVLDLRYTDWDWILSAQMMDLMTQLRELNIMGAKNWDMSHLRGRLRNIRKLRVQKSRCCNYDSSLLSEMERMELLEFSGNNCTTTTQGGTTSLLSLCGAARNSGGGLQTVIIDGCDEFEKISLQGCAQLKNLFLRGLFKSLVELDLSGTTLQTMDLSTMQLPRIQRLLLLGCEQLRAILWPPMQDRELYVVLRIDTTPRSSSSLVPHAHAHPRGGRSLQEQKEEKFNKGWRISVTDARLLRSLYPVRGYLGYQYASVHIDICPAATVGVGVGVPAGTSKSSTEAHTISTQSMVDSSKYRDVFKEVAAPPAYNYDDDGPTPSAVVMMWDCPEIYTRDKTCVIEMMIMHGQEDRKVLLEDAAQSSAGLSLPDFICHEATSLHMYDNSSSMTSIPGPPEGSTWYRLRWCRVERCPKLHTVFTAPQDGNQRIFYYLRTFWASQLLTARYVWNWPSTAPGSYMSNILARGLLPKERSFECLIFLHVDYCPRLIHVLPLPTRMATLGNLETLEIVCCGDLREVFPLDPERQEQHSPVIEFPSLKRIHLHELPKLQHICGRKVSAPSLETVKIRGCWSLRRLPAVDRLAGVTWLGWDKPIPTGPPKVDCEKEWWDRLEWDGKQDWHDPSLYQPSHSSYYKKAQLPRGTLLR